MSASDKVRLQELILYVSQKSEGDPRFGKTKLNKLLFYADFEHYARTGHSVTGQSYVRQQFGPVPSGLREALGSLEANQDLVILQRIYHGLRQEKPIARRDPDLAIFTGDEIAIVDEVIERLWGHNAREVSDLSHEFIGWVAAGAGEEIPYQTALVDAVEATEEDFRYAAELVAAGRHLEAGRPLSGGQP